MRKVASPEYVRAFAESMPPGYRERYHGHAIATHARIAAARGDDLVNVGLVDGPKGDAQAICVVAEDRPGLLSTISAAFVLCGLDVAAAEAYTRDNQAGRKEAVDVFWLRHLDEVGQGTPVSEPDIQAIRESLTALLRGDSAQREIAERRSVPPPVVRRGADAIVRFVDNEAGGLATLEVETNDRSGLLLALSSALFQAHVQIVRSEVRTVGDRVLDRFTVVEFDGSPIRSARRLEIQVAVLNAIEPARRTQPPTAETQAN